MATEQFANNAITTLNGGIAASDTSLVVNSAALFPTSPQFRVLIDSEIILVTAVSGTTFTITRGVENTTSVAHTSGATVALILTSGALDQMRSDLMSIESIGHRLTLLSSTPVTTTDITAATVIFMTPYTSNKISLYNGSVWQQFSSPQISLSLTITNGSNYDVFAFNNSGVVALELSAAWASNTARTDALTRQDGVLVKSSNLTRRYLGTIRASATNATEDSNANRYVWNYYNRVLRPATSYITTNISTSSATYATISTINFVIGENLYVDSSFNAAANKTTATGTIFIRMTIDGVADTQSVACSLTNGFNGAFAYGHELSFAAGKHALTFDWRVDTNGAAINAATADSGQYAVLTARVLG